MTTAAVPAITDRRGTWPRAILALAGAILFVLAIRWALFEPYVIPSGSMLPTLLVHDHILVNKFAYGLRLPFTSHYVIRFGAPSRGDVIVFRSVDDDSIFIIKRVIGIEGDEISFSEDGAVIVNGKPLSRRKLDREEAEGALVGWTPEERDQVLESSDLYEEEAPRGPHLTFHERAAIPPDTAQVFKVAQGQIFMMGDNRDHSNDSRFWGTLDLDRVLGRASAIWLSCEEPLADSGQLCDPGRLRWKRIFTRIP